MFIISGNSQEALRDFLTRNDIERYRARQVFHWIYKQAVFEFSEFSNLPQNIIDLLKERCAILSGGIVRKIISKKDKTTKFLIKLTDGLSIESVLLYNPDRRLTACLSTQVGCGVCCAFCASGKSGFKRNLTTSEIVTQYLLMHQEAIRNKKNITNIVFMGIGEPLLNLDNLISAIELLVDPTAANMAARRITISTAGVVPAINRLAAYKRQINLGISLHSAVDKIRTALVPLNKKYNLETLISAVKNYINKTGRMVTFEYVLIKDVNNTTQDALKLSHILKNLFCKVNIIPYNPTEGASFKTVSSKDIKNFSGMLLKNKIKILERQRKGVDINSGCGQLKPSFFEV